MDKIEITRSKVYHRTGRYAWTWVYTVTCPGEKHSFSGDGRSWAEGLAGKLSRERGIEVERTIREVEA